VAPDTTKGVAFSAGINVPLTVNTVVMEVFIFSVVVLPEFMVSLLKGVATVPPNDWAVPANVTFELVLEPE
jgi:hypothetical protein